MQAVILAAGKGTRLAPLTDELPKPLIKVHGKSILERLLESLPDEIDEVIIDIGYKGEMIRNAIGESFNKKKIIYAEQGNVNGTYGALLSARPYITSPKFLVMGADDIQDKEALQSIVKEDLAFGVHHKMLPQKEYLIVDVHNGIVRGMRRPTDSEFENPQPMATGIYVLNNTIWECPPMESKDGEYGIPQTMRPLLLEQNFTAIEMPQWIQINSHEDLAYAETLVANMALPRQYSINMS